MDSKRCSKCGETKPYDQFHKDSSTRTGLGSQCKQCTSEYARSDAGKAAQRRHKDSSKRAEWMAEYKKTEKFKKYNRAKSKRQREKAYDKCMARITLCRAVNAGEIERGPCAVCGYDGETEGHHDDHTKPLEVTWLCKQCHMNLHHPKRRLSDDTEPIL